MDKQNKDCEVCFKISEACDLRSKRCKNCARLQLPEQSDGGQGWEPDEEELAKVQSGELTVCPDCGGKK